MLLYVFAVPLLAMAQSRVKDDIYTNKNPRDYYEDRDRRYEDEAYERDEYTRRKRQFDRDAEDERIAEEDYRGCGDFDRRRLEREYVCRPRHHYNCRHDNRGIHNQRSFLFPGGQVIVNQGRHGSVRTKVWIPGHWEHSAGGHRYWVPGRYKLERVRW